jgi:PTH1 family peptidyl-tRNA hydrolase
MLGVLVMYLVAGLGNPGLEYEGTRHNAGFYVIDYLSEKLNFKVSKIKFKGKIGDCMIGDEKVIFLKPGTYMNASGESVVEAASFYKIPVENIIIVYDDKDIPIGRIRIRPSGSDGGHNGMKSIIYNLNSNEFKRVRVGIGNPDKDMVSFVLGRFSKEEAALVKQAMMTAGDAVIEIIKNGIMSSMNKYNAFNSGQE